MLRVLADQDRAQHVVDQADHEDAEGDQADALPELAGGEQVERDRRPDQRRADGGQQRQEAITTAHSIGACTPRTQNARPPSAPCAAATRTLPLTVARITVVKRSSRRALTAGVERDRGADLARDRGAVAQQEEQQVHRDAEADDEVERVLAEVDGPAGERLAALVDRRRQLGLQGGEVVEAEPLEQTRSPTTAVRRRSARSRCRS